MAYTYPALTPIISISVSTAFNDAGGITARVVYGLAQDGNLYYWSTDHWELATAT